MKHTPESRDLDLDELREVYGGYRPYGDVGTNTDSVPLPPQPMDWSGFKPLAPLLQYGRILGGLPAILVPSSLFNTGGFYG